MLVVALVNIQHHNTNGIEKLSYPEIIWMTGRRMICLKLSLNFSPGIAPQILS
jgi:hypothetical protein